MGGMSDFIWEWGREYVERKEVVRSLGLSVMVRCGDLFQFLGIRARRFRL